MESDEIPIITHIDDPWPENELTELNVGEVDSTELTVVGSAKSKDVILEETHTIKNGGVVGDSGVGGERGERGEGGEVGDSGKGGEVGDGGEAGEVNLVKVEAEVAPEMLALSIEQQPEEKNEKESLTTTLERQQKSIEVMLVVWLCTCMTDIQKNGRQPLLSHGNKITGFSVLPSSTVSFSYLLRGQRSSASHAPYYISCDIPPHAHTSSIMSLDSDSYRIYVYVITSMGT